MPMKMSQKDVDRFFGRVSKGEDCWLWVAGKDDGGYGAFCIGGKQQKAHRVSWMIHFGLIPEGLCVCHKCDVPACVNPDHLFLGTHQDNMRDMIDKGRGVQISGDLHYSKIKPDRMARGEKHGSHTKPESVLKGESHRNSKLTESSVIEIRRIYSLGGVSYQSLAKMFKVSDVTVRNIVKRKKWNHI